MFVEFEALAIVRSDSYSFAILFSEMSPVVSLDILDLADGESGGRMGSSGSKLKVERWNFLTERRNLRLILIFS